MIQRIQSVYLLLVTALLATTIFQPIGSFVSNKGMFFGFSPLNVAIPGSSLNVTPWGQLAILILGAIIAFATIFLFKNRKLQARLCILNSFVIAFYYIILCMFIMLQKGGSSELSFQPAFTISLPLVALILNLLAVRAIRNDEAKVRATDRIR